MRIFKKAAVSMTTVGLLAFGAVAASGGTAFAGAGPDQLVTGCTALQGTAAIGYQPNCTAIGGTVSNPTEIVIAVDTDSLGALITAQPGQGMDASWTLVCTVNGASVSVPGTYDVTSTTMSSTYTIDLQPTVGSPEPNQCVVEDLSVSTTLALSDAATGVAPFTVGVAAIASAATPGAIWQDQGTTTAGAHAVLCADDKNNGNSGTQIQSFQCLSDLADAFVQTSTGQLVHNGDCLSVTAGGYAFLAKCTVNNTAQRWSQSKAGGTIKNLSSSKCLTAPSAKSGIQLTVKACGTGANQKWNIPAAAAAPSPPTAGTAPHWNAIH